MKINYKSGGKKEDRCACGHVGMHHEGFNWHRNALTGNYKEVDNMDLGMCIVGRWKEIGRDNVCRCKGFARDEFEWEVLNVREGLK